MQTATTQKRQAATVAPVNHQSPPLKYAPEVEALRSDYERLADALATIAEIESERPTDVLDLRGFDAESRDHLANAREGHLYALWENLNWVDPRTVRHFYAEMRLWVEQQKFEHRQARIEQEAQ